MSNTATAATAATATTTAPTPLETARRIWATAQTFRCPQRWDAESLAFQVARVDQQISAEFDRYGLSYAQALLAGEDEPGYAFAYGMTIYWSPTKGRLKRQWYSFQKTLKQQGANYGPVMGPIIACSSLEAIKWQEG